MVQFAAEWIWLEVVLSWIPSKGMGILSAETSRGTWLQQSSAENAVLRHGSRR